MTVVTGESGSGKSTLINEILYQGLSNIKTIHHMEPAPTRAWKEPNTLIKSLI